MKFLIENYNICIDNIIENIIVQLEHKGYDIGFNVYAGYSQITAKKTFLNTIKLTPRNRFVQCEILQENIVTRTIKNGIFNSLVNAFLSPTNPTSNFNESEINDIVAVINKCCAKNGKRVL